MYVVLRVLHVFSIQDFCGYSLHIRTTCISLCTEIDFELDIELVIYFHIFKCVWRCLQLIRAQVTLSEYMLFCVCCTFYPFTYLWSCLQRNGIHMNIIYALEWICCAKGQSAEQPKEKQDAVLLDYDKFHSATCYVPDEQLQNILKTTFNLKELGRDEKEDHPLPEKIIVVTCKAKTRGTEDLFSALENFEEEELNRVIFIYRVFEESQKLSTYMLENDSKYYRVKAIFNYSEVKKEFLLNGSFHDAVQDVLDKKEP